MAKTKKIRQVSQLSCELGEGDFAIGYNAKGRPIRNRRSTIQEPYLEDEACASSEDEDEDDDVDPDFDDVSDSIDVEPTRKRKRKRNWSPSPAMTMPFATAAKHAKFGSCSESADCDDLPPSPSAGPSKPTTLHLAVNIPAGHQGLIRLHLDPTKAAAHLGQATLATTDMLEENARKRWSTTSKTKKKNFQSFLGMSGEVKNHIYRAVFASSTEIDFGAPIRFSRTAALLRTCREVYEEGTCKLVATSEVKPELMHRREEHPLRRESLRHLPPIDLLRLDMGAPMARDRIPEFSPVLQDHRARQLHADPAREAEPRRRIASHVPSPQERRRPPFRPRRPPHRRPATLGQALLSQDAEAELPRPQKGGQGG